MSALRAVLCALAGIVCLTGTGNPVAQEFPSKALRIVDLFAPGGNSDLQARLIAPEVAKLLGQPVIVENRPGAGGLVALEYVATQVPADGYTLVISSPVIYILPHTVRDLRFNPVRDLPPISIVSESALLLATPYGAPWKTFDEFVSYAKANPGKLNYGTAGLGIGLLVIESVRQKYALDMVAIAYKGGAPQTSAAIMNNEVQLSIQAESSLSFVKGGKMRVLAVTGDKRLASIPEVPTFAELGMADMPSTLFSLHVRAGVTTEIIAKLHSAVATALQQPSVRDRLAQAQLYVAPSSSPQAAAARISEQASIVAAIAKRAGIQPQ